jgi:ATP-binding cassette subfamily C protein LapB
LVARRNIVSFLSEPRSSTTFKSAGLDIRSDFAINISNVTLRLSPNATPIFSNLDIQIKKGERVAIIGPTGAGKTTLSNLVCGLVAPEVGSIQLNGVDCRMINRSDFFKSVGVVFQEPWLFSGTLRENISMGFENVNDHDILEAVRLSGANINPEQPDETLDAVILSQGKNLSGGQKQSIALSRAVLFDQPLLVMDEPTSAMDQMMEDRLVERLSSYAKGKTLLLITHKPNMLKLCDRIIVLDQGRITFNGSKEQYVELVKKNV